MSSSVLICRSWRLTCDNSACPNCRHSTFLTVASSSVIVTFIWNHLSHSFAQHNLKSLISSHKWQNSLYTVKCISLASLNLPDNSILVASITPSFSPEYLLSTSVGASGVCISSNFIFIAIAPPPLIWYIFNNRYIRYFYCTR